MAQKRALLIGVGTYGEGLAPIPSAPRDVDALAELLRAPQLGGFDPEAVQVLKDPGRTEMETAVEALFANRKADDLLLLYFSGHGLRDEKRQLFLACRETSKVLQGPARGRLRQATALRARTLQDYMQASPSQRQLVILDCCFSGAMAIGMTVKDEGRIDLAEVLGGEGRAILTSSAATELSAAGEAVEGDASGSGEGLSAYTRFLVEGIRTGAADRAAAGLRGRRGPARLRETAPRRGESGPDAGVLPHPHGPQHRGEPGPPRSHGDLPQAAAGAGRGAPWCHLSSRAHPARRPAAGAGPCAARGGADRG
jgi:hypothetical protein